MFTLRLDYPPTVNHQYSIIRGRPVLSREVRGYRQIVRQQVQEAGMPVLLGPLALRLELSPPDHRRRDSDNALKPLLDALQQSGVFVDDSQIVWLLTLKLQPVPHGQAVTRIWRLADGPVPPEFLLSPEL